MVVGLGKYKDQKEAYPLDNKTLNKVALRSILTGFSNNLETGSSIGWLNALEPALRKIHTNEEDLALSMGHNLEYVQASTSLSSLAMGAVLALEAKKSDLENIRSTRLAISGISEGLGFLYYLLVWIVAASFLPNNKTLALGIIGIFFVLEILLRFILIKVGYKQASRLSQNFSKKGSKITKAFQALGLVMIGILIIYVSFIASNYFTIDFGKSFNFDINYLNFFVSLAVTYLLYHLLTKKNFSIFKCFIVTVALAVLFGILRTFI